MTGAIQKRVRNPSTGSEEKPETIFGWSRNRRIWLYLGGFLFFSAVIHGAGFYLFQVVYPTPSRVEPDGGRIVLLSRDDPEMRNLLQRVEDRSVFFLPVSRDSNVRVEMGDAMVPFSPSYEARSPEIRPPEYPWSLPLSSFVSEPDWGPPGVLASRVVLAKEGELNGRIVAPWSIFRDYLSRIDWIPELRFELEVAPEGDVSVIRAEGEVEETIREELVGVVESTLRFNPAAVTSRGWVRIYSPAD